MLNALVGSKGCAAIRADAACQGGRKVTRELKLALIVGFSLLLVVTVLISDHLSKARTSELASTITETPAMVPVEGPKEALVPQPVALPGETSLTAAPVAMGTPTPADQPMVIQQGVSQDDDSLAQAIESDDAIIVPSGTGTTGVPMVGTVTLSNGMEDLSRAAAGQASNAAGEANSTESAAVAPVANSPAPVTSEKSAARTHTVVAGDTLSKISRKYYGDSKHWKRIATANQKVIGKNGEIKIGAKLTIPSDQVETPKSPATPKTTLGSTERAIASNEKKTETKELPKALLKSSKVASASAAGRYTVKSGDTLSAIARRELGSIRRVKDLVELNKDQLGGNNDAVRVGMVLKLPKN